MRGRAGGATAVEAPPAGADLQEGQQLTSPAYPACLPCLPCLAAVPALPGWLAGWLWLQNGDVHCTMRSLSMSFGVQVQQLNVYPQAMADNVEVDR